MQKRQALLIAEQYYEAACTHRPVSTILQNNPINGVVNIPDSTMGWAGLQSSPDITRLTVLFLQAMLLLTLITFLHSEYEQLPPLTPSG